MNPPYFNRITFALQYRTSLGKLRCFIRRFSSHDYVTTNSFFDVPEWSIGYALVMVDYFGTIKWQTIATDIFVLRGDPASRSFSCCYLRDGELIALDAVNHAKDFMAARKLIAERARPDLSKLADDTVALRDSL